MTIKFYKTNDPYGSFNNFKKSPIFIYNRWWKNAESAYQAQKTLDSEEYESIWSAKTPREAMNLGQKVKIREDWENIKIQVMYECVLTKFTTHKDLKELLLSTGEEEIIEDSPSDFFWGCGSDGTGQNNLGKILMAVRTKLRSK